MPSISTPTTSRGSGKDKEIIPSMLGARPNEGKRLQFLKAKRDVLRREIGSAFEDWGDVRQWIVCKIPFRNLVQLFSTGGNYKTDVLIQLIMTI